MLCNPHRHHVGRVAVVNSTVPTSTGTKSFTVSGFDNRTPVGFIILGNCTSSFDTEASDSSMSIGFGDGTSEHAASMSADDGVTTSSTGTYISNTKCYVAGTGNASTTLIEASFSSFDDLGVTINFTKVDGTAYKITILLFFDCNFAVGETLVGTALPTYESVCGFKPTGAIYTIINQSSFSTDGAVAGKEARFGFCGSEITGDTSEDIDSMMAFINNDGATTTVLKTRSTQHVVSRRVNGSDNYSHREYSDTGHVVNQSSTISQYMSWCLFDNIRVAELLEKKTEASGASDITLPINFTPHAALMVGTSSTSINGRVISSVGTDDFGLGAVSNLSGSVVQAGYNMRQMDAVTTTVEKQESTQSYFNIPAQFVFTGAKDGAIEITHNGSSAAYSLLAFGT